MRDTTNDVIAENCLISAKDACRLLGVGRSFFYGNIVNRNLIKPVKYSSKCVRYRIGEVMAYIDAATQTEHEPYGY